MFKLESLNKIKSSLGKHDNIFYRCVEDLNESVMITDSEGVLIYVNPAWCKKYGYSEEEAIGQTPALLHSGKQSDVFYDEMWKTIRSSQGHWKGELINKAKDGTLIPVLLSITAFRKEGMPVSGYMGIALDLTNQKNLERQILQQDRLASIGLLASGLAHEIGTPLGVIRGRAELLSFKAHEETVKDGLGIIIHEIDRISKLIQSLLRLNRPKENLKILKVNVKKAVEEVLILIDQNFLKNDVNIHFDVDESFVALIDPGRFQQIILNLLVNSLHAIQEKREKNKQQNLIIAGEAFVKISATKENENIVVKIKDTGCGISKKNMKHIFDPFFTTKDIGKGTGLGLSIVAKIVHEMDGEISVESEEGEGTEFTLIFRDP